MHKQDLNCILRPPGILVLCGGYRMINFRQQKIKWRRQMKYFSRFRQMRQNEIELCNKVTIKRMLSLYRDEIIQFSIEKE